MRPRGKAMLAMGAGLFGLALQAAAQTPPAPDGPVADGIETIHSQGYLELETVISRAGWHLMGRDPEGYRIGTAATPGMTGKIAAFLQACNGAALLGHGAIEHTLPAGIYAGKRVRVRARMKNDGNGRVNLYVNALAAKGNIIRNRSLAISGASNDWQSRAVVMDVPDDAALIEIGVALWNSGGTIVWVDPVSIEIVDESVALAGGVGTSFYQREDQDAPLNCEGIRQ